MVFIKSWKCLYSSILIQVYEAMWQDCTTRCEYGCFFQTKYQGVFLKSKMFNDHMTPFFRKGTVTFSTKKQRFYILVKKWSRIILEVFGKILYLQMVAKIRYVIVVKMVLSALYMLIEILLPHNFSEICSIKWFHPFYRRMELPLFI